MGPVFVLIRGEEILVLRHKPMEEAEYRLQGLVMERLRDKGVPIKGTLLPEVASGTLEASTVPGTLDRLYRWTP